MSNNSSFAKSSNSILKYSTYILGIIAFILFAMGLSKKYTVESDATSFYGIVGLYKVNLANSTTLNATGIAAVIFFCLFAISYIAYVCNTKKAQKKFNLYACLFVVAVICVLIIGFVGKPYTSDSGTGNISPFLKQPGVAPSLTRYGETNVTSISLPYTTAGIACVVITSLIGAGSICLIVVDCLKTIKNKQ